MMVLLQPPVITVLIGSKIYFRTLGSDTFRLHPVLCAKRPSKLGCHVKEK